jgi:predicted RNase H-like nuclease (RuvC/YqgF family)
MSIMKVHRDFKGELDLEVRIERLTQRVKDLENINKQHQKLNGELREELNNVRKTLARIS